MTFPPTVRLAWLPLLLIGSGCEAPVGSSRYAVLQGQVPGADELLSLIGISTNVGVICSGTLISPTAVLTAAHCVDPAVVAQALPGLSPEDISFQATTSRSLERDFQGGIVQPLPIATIEWHEGFDGSVSGGVGNEHDFGLIHLAEPVTDRPAQRLATPDVTDAISPGDPLLIAGYGMVNGLDTSSGGQLARGLTKLDVMGQAELAAGAATEQRACHGDSGGPVFADDSDSVEIGVASRIKAGGAGQNDCTPGVIYGRVDQHLDWISERVPDLPADPGPGSGGGDEGGGCAVGRARPASPVGATLLLALVTLGATRRRPSRRGRDRR